MQRLTRTRLEKLLYIHDCRVDQIVDDACSKLDAVISKPSRKSKLAPSRREELRAINTRLTALEYQGAIAQAATVWLTPQQVAARQGQPRSHDYSGMNTSRAPTRFYNPL